MSAALPVRQCRALDGAPVIAWGRTTWAAAGNAAPTTIENTTSRARALQGVIATLLSNDPGDGFVFDWKRRQCLNERCGARTMSACARKSVSACATAARFAPAA